MIMALIDQDTLFVGKLKAADSKETLIGLTFPGLSAFAVPLILHANTLDFDKEEERQSQFTVFTVNRAQNEVHQIKVEYIKNLHKEPQSLIEKF